MSGYYCWNKKTFQELPER